MKNYPCVEFVRPNALQVHGFVEVSEHTATWLESRGAAVSFENCGLFYAVYLDVGFCVGDEESNEPDEITVIKKPDETVGEAIARGVATAIAMSNRPIFPVGR